MKDQSLALSFSDSITGEMSGISAEYAELGLDALLEDGLLKDIPIVSTAVSIYRIGKSFRERHHMAKLITFLDGVNKGICNEDKRQEYRDKFYSNEDFRNKEIEYILVLIDRYINLDKPRMLAKLYLAYLDEKINWARFLEFSEILDRLLPSDLDCLFEFMCHGGVDFGKTKIEIASVLRLLAVGFVKQGTPELNALIGAIDPNDSMDYLITNYGREFVRIFESDIRAVHNKMRK